VSLTLPRLYPILDIDACSAQGIAPMELLDVWLEAGVRLVQLRAKHLASGAMLSLSEAMAARCRDAGAIFIVNDRADVAKMAAADGVHVGQDDLPASDARTIVGDASIVGVSTHTFVQLAAALRGAISYVAIGPVFSTATKANPDPVVGLALVSRAAEAARAAGVPLVAIGGIRLETAKSVLDAGADAVAVIADLLVGEPRTRVREYLQALAPI
jgi:thiamine-phosphate pyrophosphorylase